MSNAIGERLVDIFQPDPNGPYILNLPALQTLVSWAEGDEALAAKFGTWDQGHWAKALLGEGWGNEVNESTVFEETRNGVCQSAYCMAGQTVVQAGYRLIYQTYGEHEDGKDVYSTTDCVKQEYLGRGPDGRPRFRDTGQVQSISSAAREVLGLDWREADYLFDGDNGIPDLKALINAMCVRRGLPVEYDEYEINPGEFQDDTDEYLHSLREYTLGTGY